MKMFTADQWHMEESQFRQGTSRLKLYGVKSKAEFYPGGPGEWGERVEHWEVCWLACLGMPTLFCTDGGQTKQSEIKLYFLSSFLAPMQSHGKWTNDPLPRGGSWLSFCPRMQGTPLWHGCISAKKWVRIGPFMCLHLIRGLNYSQVKAVWAAVGLRPWWRTV